MQFQSDMVGNRSTDTAGAGTQTAADAGHKDDTDEGVAGLDTELAPLVVDISSDSPQSPLPLLSDTDGAAAAWSFSSGSASDPEIDIHKAKGSTHLPGKQGGAAAQKELSTTDTAGFAAASMAGPAWSAELGGSMDPATMLKRTQELLGHGVEGSSEESPRR
jgi:hypothetical protein